MQDLLYLVHRIPYPPNKGDKIRSYHLLKYLSAHFRVHLGCFIDDAGDRQYIPKLAAMCASTCFIDHHMLGARLRSLGGLFSGTAMSVAYYRDATLQAWVRQHLASGKFGHALAFSGPMAQYLQPPPGSAKLRRVIDFVDVDSEKWCQFALTKWWPLAQLYRHEGRQLLEYERTVAQQFDAATFVSRAEAALFQQRAPHLARAPEFFSNGVDAAFFSPEQAHANPYPDGARVLVFTGAMDYWPNIDAVSWFAAQVLPALRAQFPRLCLYIVGTRPAAAVKALAQLPGVCVTGAVPDIRPYLAHASLAVAPLRFARGIQNKVLEAMAMEKTVVASPQALEGISAVPGLELVLADGADAFIGQLARLLQAGSEHGIGAAARKRVLQDYCWEKNLESVGALLGLQQQLVPLREQRA